MKLKKVYLVEHRHDGERLFITIDYDAAVARWYSGEDAIDNDTTACVEDDSSWDNCGANTGMLEDITNEWIDQFFEQYEILDERDFD